MADAQRLKTWVIFHNDLQRNSKTLMATKFFLFKDNYKTSQKSISSSGH